MAALLVRSDWLERKGHDPDCYFMPRPKREEYEAWLNAASGQHPEPAKVAVSQTLHDLEKQIASSFNIQVAGAFSWSRPISFTWRLFRAGFGWWDSQFVLE